MAKYWKRLGYEQELWARGVSVVAGVDEAGCGPLAGPVVAAAVVFPCAWLQEGLCKKLRGLNDSKQLTEEEREKFYAVLTSHPDIRFAVAIVDVEMIDQINIYQATHRAMNLAVAQLRPTPDHVLVDGRPVKSLQVPHTPLIKGDCKSYSIAAASVVAKVTRDRLMIAYDLQYPGYGFAEHKGYATPQHYGAIQRLGACAIHRRTFSPFKPIEMELFPEDTARSTATLAGSDPTDAGRYQSKEAALRRMVASDEGRIASP
jgi:ribonuclease HII